MLATLVGWLTSARTMACPVCETETGRQIRQGIFDAAFPYHLLVTLLPFAVVTVAVLLLPRLLRAGKARSR